MTILFAVFTVIVIGYLAQDHGICLVRACKELLERRPGLLLAILTSGLWVWLYAIIAAQLAVQTPFQRFEAHFVFALGGLVFGIGAGLNQACSISTLYTLAQGKLVMLATLFGWICGWVLFTIVQDNFIYIDYQMSGIPAQQSFWAAAIISAVITLFVLYRFPRQRALWLGTSAIGALAGVMFWLEPAWSPSSLVQDTGAAFLWGDSPPSLRRLLIFFALLFGMWLAAWRADLFSLVSIKAGKFNRHFIGGNLMGIGAAMALGGNDAQLLVGFPAASIGGFLALAGMISGIIIEQSVFKRWYAARV